MHSYWKTLQSNVGPNRRFCIFNELIFDFQSYNEHLRQIQAPLIPFTPRPQGE